MSSFRTGEFSSGVDPDERQSKLRSIFNWKGSDDASNYEVVGVKDRKPVPSNSQL